MIPDEQRPSSRLLHKSTEENVDALLETVRGLLSAEDARDQSFNTRGVGLAGFVGIIVSLSTTIGRDALASRLVSPWQSVAIGLFALALLGLLGTVVVVVLGVLRPRESATLAYEEVERYPFPEYVFAPKVMNQGKTLRGLVDALAIERRRATRKARSLRWAYRLLILGLSAVAALGFILGLHNAQIIKAQSARAGQHSSDRPCPRDAASTAASRRQSERVPVRTARC